MGKPGETPGRKAKGAKHDVVYASQLRRCFSPRLGEKHFLISGGCKDG